MKSSIAVFFIALLTRHADAQQGITERLIGYKNFGEYNFSNDNFLNCDSARFYYADKNNIYENPFNSDLFIPPDTLEYYINFSNWYDFQNYYNHDFLLRDHYYNLQLDNNIAYDSVLTFNEYHDEWNESFGYSQSFDSGRITESSENGWSDFLLYHYDYDDNGKLSYYYKTYTFEGVIDTIYEAWYHYMDGLFTESHWTGQYPGRRNLLYGATGNLTEKIDEDLNVETGEYAFSYKTEYNHSGTDLTEINNFSWDGINWDNYKKTSIGYSEHLISSVTLIDSWEDETDTSFISYSYNQYNKIDSIIKYNYSEYYETIDTTSIEIFEYDDNKLLTLYKIIGQWGAEFIVDYDYNGSKQLIELTQFSTVSDPSGEWVYGADYRFQYNAYGNPIYKEENYMVGNGYIENIDDSSNITGTVFNYWATNYYYETIANSSAGTETQTIYIHVFPSPASEQINIFVGDALQNGTITIKIFDITGQVVYKETMEPGLNFSHTIDCSNFSSGIYVVTASDGLNTSMQKVMVK
ncbi:MAG: T9SS type A sorting domain-containing protein [Chitinophagales bacterium]